MHPLVKALLSSWEWRLEIVAVLLTLGALYTLGWFRLRRQSKRGQLANWPRLLSYYAGLAILAVSLLSPIDRLGGQLFFMHMLQHMLSIMLAAPLLLLANPFPFMVWALPAALRMRVASLFSQPSGFRRGLAAVTRPFIVWLIFLTVYLGWHDASLYDLALRQDWVHDIQHITFFGAAMLFWWHDRRRPASTASAPAGRAWPILIGVIPPNMAVAATIAFAFQCHLHLLFVGPAHLGLHRCCGSDDQRLSSWIPGSMMFLLAALIILGTHVHVQGAAARQTRRLGRRRQVHCAGPGASRGAEPLEAA